MVYGEGDVVILKRIELPGIRDEWNRLKSLVDKRVAKYAEMTEDG